MEIDIIFNRLINVMKTISKEEIIFAFQNAQFSEDWTSKEFIENLASSFEVTFK